MNYVIVYIKSTLSIFLHLRAHKVSKATQESLESPDKL